MSQIHKDQLNRAKNFLGGSRILLLCQTRVSNFDSENCLEESLTTFSTRQTSSSLSSYCFVDESYYFVFSFLYRPDSAEFLIKATVETDSMATTTMTTTTTTTGDHRYDAPVSWMRNADQTQKQPRRDARERKKEREPPSLFHSTTEKQHLVASQSNFRTNKNISLIHLYTSTHKNNMVRNSLY